MILNHFISIFAVLLRDALEKMKKLPAVIPPSKTVIYQLHSFQKKSSLPKSEYSYANIHISVCEKYYSGFY
jgi:hypothetical protein